jgi:hypothetical protein
MNQEDARWHWGEGTKYGLEAIKALLIINGAAAVSILTFIGNTKAHEVLLILALVSFAFGVVTGVATHICAYLTQLVYGNLSTGRGNPYHFFTYCFALAGIFFFVAGVLLAAVGLYAFKPN